MSWLWSAALAAGMVAMLYGRYHDVLSLGDEGSVCTIAQGAASGLLPLRDYFNEKLPLQYFLTAFVLRFAGSDIEAVRLLSWAELWLTLAVAIAAFDQGRTDVRKSLLFGAALALACLGFSAVYNLSEASLALLFAVCALLLTRPQCGESKFLGFALGFVHGTAIGFRQTALLPALILVAWCWRKPCRYAYLGGLAGGIGVWMAILASLGLLGATAEVLFMEHAPAGVFSLYRRLPTPTDWPGLLLWLALVALATWAARAQRGVGIAVVAWCVTLALPFFGRMDAFRLWPSIVALVVLVCHIRGTPVVGRAVVALLAATGIASTWIGDPMRDYGMQQEMGRRIAELVPAGQRIWVQPFEPTLYCFADRRPASRYYFILPWIASKKVQSELLRDLTDRPPPLIVHARRSPSLDAYAPEVARFIADNYELAFRLHGREFYLHRSQPGVSVQAALDGATAGR